MLAEPTVVFCDEKKKNSLRQFYGAPDMVIEILSSSTRKKRYGIKTEKKYITARVREYWMVDPDKKKKL